MPIVGDGQLNLAALVVDDIYVVIIPPQTPLIQGFPTDGIGIVGTGSKGEPNKPYLIGDPASAVRAFGDINTHQNDLVTEIMAMLKQGANNIYGIRVTDGTDVKASANLTDNAGSPANLVKLTALTSGIDGNNIIANVGVGSNNTALAATGTVTIGGTWTAADTVTIVLNGTSKQYTVVANDTPQTIAQALAALINGDPLTANKASASVSGGVITLTAVTRGTIGNALTLTTSKTSTGGTSTASGATLAGGTGTQAYRVTLRTASDVPEIFDNITGTAGTGVGSAAANIINAINNGVPGIRGPSSIATAAVSTDAPVGTGSLLNQQVTLSGGTDGRTGVTTSALLGVDGFTRTGMYALRGLPVAQFGIAGMADPTSWSTQLAFAKSEENLAVLGMAQATGSLAAVAAKQSNGIDDYHAVVVKDHLYLNDTKNGQIRLISPIGATLGRIATLSPERSPGNKPVYGFLGTERTGYTGPGGSFRAGVPYSTAEIALLESAGINFFNTPAVGGNYMAMRHGQNSSSDPTRNGINYSKMTQFIAKSLHQSMGWAVNETHTQELRRRVKSSLTQFLESLANPGPGRNPMIGDADGGPAYYIQCDGNNNPKNMVALGYMFVYVQVKYLSIVRFFVLQVEAGQSVSVRVQEQAPLNLAA